MTPEVGTDPLQRKSRGGRQRGDPEALRAATIGVRVSQAEYTALREKASGMNMTPAQWLREAALSRRLPAPRRAEAAIKLYAEMGGLVADLHGLLRRASDDDNAAAVSELLRRLIADIRPLRLALIRVKPEEPAAAVMAKPAASGQAAAA